MLRISKFFAWLSSPRASWLTVPLSIFLFTRLLVLVGGYVPALLGISLIPETVEVVSGEMPPGLEVWARWDTVWYPSIAASGYNEYVPGGNSYAESSVAYFPLYPLLIAIVMPLFGYPLLAGMILSNIAFLGALILLYKMTREWTNRLIATRTIFYLAAFPGSMFLSVAYTESLFLLLTLGATYFARSRCWGWAAVCGALATATRMPGVLLMIIVGLEWAAAQGWTIRTIGQADAWRNLFQGIRQYWRQLLIIALIPLGLAAYMIYLQIAFGAPMAWLDATSAWGRDFADPITVIIRDISRVLRGETLGGHALVFIDAINVILVFVVLFMLPAIVRHVGGIYALYCFASVVIPLFTRSESMARYVAIMFPVFIVLGVWGKRRWLDLALKVIFLPMLALFTTLFVNWVFVG